MVLVYASLWGAQLLEPIEGDKEAKTVAQFPCSVSVAITVPLVEE